MEIGIIGGGFTNKGAETMVFNVSSRIKEKYPNSTINVFVSNKSNLTRYPDIDVEVIYFSQKIQSFVYKYLGLLKIPVIRNIVRRFRGNITSYFDALNKCDLFIDVTGFSYSSKFSMVANEYFIENKNLLIKLKKKYYLMPQSMGPFEFKADVIKRIKKTLNNAEKVFVRDEQSSIYLKSIGFSNHRVCYDTGFSLDIKLENQIFNTKLHYNYEIMNNSVCIVPNLQVCKRIGEKTVLEAYIHIIDYLNKLGKNVYLLNHCSEQDKELCDKISLLSPHKVHCLFEEYNCFEMERIVSQFDYIISSRFHSLVLAYSVATPSLILGWAEKYLEIAKMFNQEQYLLKFDSDIDLKLLENSINTINVNYTQEKNLILNKIDKIKIESELCINEVLENLVNINEA
ncbi:MAG: polysaccharide pyruvyl transferase family protein [Spirochaetaceae bacterium]